MTFLAVDGNSIVNRAFYGIKLLTTKDGQYTNAIYGFLTMLDKIKETVQPDCACIAFDLKTPTFRHKTYSEYKAGRKGMPPELASQMPVLKEILTVLGYKLAECEGFEADDILGTIAGECDRSGVKCVIATGDRDSLQLISDNVTVRLASTKMGKPEAELYDTEKIKEKYGVTPVQMIELKAIQGDSSDNIPGVPGIGEKGAQDLIQRFGNIEYIYENIETIDVKPGIRKKLIAGKESAFMSKMLGTISREAPIERDLSAYKIGEINAETAVRKLAALELFSLIKKWDLRSDVKVQETEAQTASLPKLCAEPDIAKTLEYIKKEKQAFFISQIDSCSLSKLYIRTENSVDVFEPEQAETILRDILPVKEIQKHTSNSKALFAYAQTIGIDCQGIETDIQLAGYLLNPSASSYDTNRLCEEYGISLKYYDDSLFYSSEAASCTAYLPVLCDTLNKKLAENKQLDLLHNIEIPLAQVLADMELCGFKIDSKGIEDYGKQLGEKADKLKAEIYDSVGYEFNINSPKQLGEALFVKLGLPSSKKTKSGYSTSAEVLEGLRYAHPAIDMILEYRSLTKLKSTYCDALVKVTDEKGRIHSVFNQTETRTGRISSLEPNLQNIPVKTAVGKELRRFFTADEGNVLIDADYSQIELRVLAHISNDKEMIKAFNEGIDIHTVTASQVFSMPESMINSALRSRAKAVNFGIVYGIGAFSLSKDIGVTRKEADNYIKSYLRHYSGVDAFMNNAVSKAKDLGYAETMLGRRRYLPELTSSNFNLRSFGERVARNMPIQGTAADIIKIAMIKVYNRLKAENMKSKLILQVHDELILEAPIEEAEKAKAILTEEMESAVKLQVPLTADGAVGKTWYDAKA